MTDFAVLPPEVTSARLYAGSGSSPLMAAAAAWDRLAATLGSAAASYRSVVTELADESWQGPASASMAAAAEPYVQWMTATAATAAQTAEQARVAAAAYEAAHAGAVPPAAVAANRAELSSLTAGNLLGQNNAAIAANQAEYQVMWAQDAMTMQAYAASSAAAVKPVTGFAPAPQTTTAAGSAQAGSSATNSGLEQLLTGIYNVLSNSSLNSGPLMDLLQSPLVTGFNTFSTKVSGILSFVGGQGFMTAGVGVGGFDLPIQGAISASYLFAALNPASVGLASSVSGATAAEGTLAGATLPAAAIPAAIGATPAAPAISATLGRAATVGGLSAPQSWISAAPQEIRLAVASTSMAMAVPGVSQAGPMPSAGGFMGGVPMMAGMVNAPNGGPGSGAAKPGEKKTSPAAAAIGGGIGAAAMSPQREELNRLRQVVVEMTMQRDALKRSAASVIRKVKQR